MPPTDKIDPTEPHLFVAKNAHGDDVLWWGTSPDDTTCTELDLGFNGMGIAPRKALWAAIMGSDSVEDCLDWPVPE